MRGLELISSYQLCIVKRMPQTTALAIPKRVLKNIHLKICFLKSILDYNVFICDFHREQAWETWLNAIKNGARMIKSEMLCKFRRIARSRTAKELKNAIDDLQNCEQWRSGYTSMVNWFEKQWMPDIKVSYILVNFTNY